MSHVNIIFNGYMKICILYSPALSQLYVGLPWIITGTAMMMEAAGSSQML
jgi:hypothetical protein